MKKGWIFLFLFFVGFQLRAQVKQPNIILFLVDDMGWQDCSLPFWDKPTKLNAIYHTPNMERLAAKGMMLTNAYSNSVCTPTRVSLMTGMNVARHGVTNWTNVNSNTPTDFKDSVLQPATWNYNGLTPELHYTSALQHTVVATPLPQILKEAGYYTIHAGKAHFASTGMPGASPINMGFDVNIGGSAAGHPGSFLASKNYRQHEKDTSWAVRGLEKYIPEDLYLTEAITREAIHTLEARVSNKPFFLYLSHYAVHVPYEKDIRFYQKYMDAGLTDTEAKYAALVEGMDKSLGDIINYIEKNGLDIRVLTLCKPDLFGFTMSGIEFYKNPSDFSENQPYINRIREMNIQNKIIFDLNKEEMLEHMITFLVGVDIVLQSRVCVTDYSSNVGRFIKLWKGESVYTAYKEKCQYHEAGKELDLEMMRCPSY